MAVIGLLHETPQWNITSQVTKADPVLISTPQGTDPVQLPLNR